MTDDELLEDLAEKWEEHSAQGRDVPPEELCPADRPDLLPELANRIARLKRMTWLGRVAPEDPPFANSSPPAADRQPGGVPLKGFALLKRRGGGAFGEVWEASGPTGRRAIKFLNGDITASGKEGERVRAEQRGLELMARVRHPYIIRLIETHVVGNELLVVSELADDEMGEWVRRKWGSMPPERLARECLTLLRTAAEALDDIWVGHRLQHGDVKPANLLVSGEVSKLGDFGTVTRLQEKGADADRVILCDPTGRVHGFNAASQVPWGAALGAGATLYTAAGSFTPRYAPPEAFEGKTSPTFDQYSLALTFCELVYGRLPFSEDGDQLEKRRRGDMDLEFLPAPIRPVLARALSPQPPCRFPSCTGFWNALSDGYRELDPLTAGIETPGRRDKNRNAPPATDERVDDSPPWTDKLIRPGNIALAPGARSPGAFTFAVGVEPSPGYRLQRVRGRGGFAEVWEATSPEGLPVALKFIPSSNVGATARELRSVQSFQALEHPYIVKTHGTWSVPGYIVINMELAEATLLDLMQLYHDDLGQPIPPAVLCLYLCQVAEALDFLNARRHVLAGRKVGFQHGDVKPNNILLFGDVAKLTDHGLATPTYGPTTPCPRQGTREYAAPEVFEGYLSNWSDQYSLAITYYALRVGTFPFPPVPKDASRSYNRPLADLSGVTEPERAPLLRALSPVPNHRFPSCRDFMAAVLKALGLRVEGDGMGGVKVVK